MCAMCVAGCVAVCVAGCVAVCVAMCVALHHVCDMTHPYINVLSKAPGEDHRI